MVSVHNRQPVLTGDVVLRGLRWALHSSVAALLVIGATRALGSQPGLGVSWAVLLVSMGFAVVYSVGVAALRRMPKAWLATVTALWVGLMLLHPDFTWLAFPLFFLHMYLLRTWHGLLSVVVLTSVVVTVQWWSAGAAQVATLLGPGFGAAVAVVMALAYQALSAENQHQQTALEQLRLTRQELAASQREAGALAERERMAREIHDTLAQGFSSVVLLSRAAESSLGGEDYGAASEQVATIRSTAEENLVEARRFVRSPQSGHQERQPLTKSLERACETVEAQAAARGAGLRCRLAVNGDPVPLPTAQGVALLRAAQSSLSNVAQHAGASTAVVTLTFLEDTVLLDVVDDGAGFAIKTASGPRDDGSGYGLVSVRDRVEALEGQFLVESAPGSGTAIAVRLPLGGGAGDA